MWLACEYQGRQIIMSARYGTKRIILSIVEISAGLQQLTRTLSMTLIIFSDKNLLLREISSDVWLQYNLVVIKPFHKAVLHWQLKRAYINHHDIVATFLNGTLQASSMLMK